MADDQIFKAALTFSHCGFLCQNPPTTLWLVSG